MKASATLPNFSFKKDAGPAPGLPPLDKPLHQIYGRRWTTETKRYLHVRNERRWLALKHKHQFLDFSPQERVELRRYFDELAGPNGRITLEQLETMLISLGLAENPREVRFLADQVDDLNVGELDFEQYLELVLGKTNSNLVTVFMQMACGKLGNANLNFKTLISAYRRQLFLDASGAQPACTFVGSPPSKNHPGSRPLTMNINRNITVLSWWQLVLGLSLCRICLAD
ncbi:FTSH10 [Symbiodinium pilosum]|uniref:FTSH10 protein n=1 Tax=Symbiodinium pilosum TaxID=2952 RepID=A0A812NI58_SYMPI|nr:FTSH10 [Symbiodinium pilosum]